MNHSKSAFLCWLECHASSGGNAIEYKLTDDGIVWGGVVGVGGAGRECNICQPRGTISKWLRRAERRELWSPARRHRDRRGETGWETQIQMDGETEGDEDRLTVRETLGKRRGREKWSGKEDGMGKSRWAVVFHQYCFTSLHRTLPTFSAWECKAYSMHLTLPG